MLLGRGPTARPDASESYRCGSQKRPELTRRPVAGVAHLSPRLRVGILCGECPALQEAGGNQHSPSLGCWFASLARPARPRATGPQGIRSDARVAEHKGAPVRLEGSISDGDGPDGAGSAGSRSALSTATAARRPCAAAARSRSQVPGPSAAPLATPHLFRPGPLARAGADDQWGVINLRQSSKLSY